MKNDERMKIIGAKIRETRLNRKMTLKEVAKRVGIAENTLIYYEKGRIGAVSIDRIKAIAEALDVTPEFLLGWDKASNSCEVVQLKLEVLNDNELFQVSNYIDFLIAQRKK